MQTRSSILWMESFSGPNSNDLARESRQEPTVGRSTARREHRPHTRNRLHRCGERVHERTSRCEKRLADQRPLKIVLRGRPAR